MLCGFPSDTLPALFSRPLLLSLLLAYLNVWMFCNPLFSCSTHARSHTHTHTYTHTHTHTHKHTHTLTRSHILPAQLFDPTDLTEDLTPATCRKALAVRAYVRAALIALRLRDSQLLIQCLYATPQAQVCVCGVSYLETTSTNARTGSQTHTHTCTRTNTSSCAQGYTHTNT